MAVYFARAATTTFVKIGYAVSVERRMLHLQAGCPYPLNVVRKVEGDRLAEAAFHHMFRGFRIEREWFDWDESMATAEIVERAPVGTSGSFSDLIEELGGVTIVASRLGVAHQSVRKYRQRNRIPAWQWPAFQTLGVSAERLIACEVARGAT